MSAIKVMNSFLYSKTCRVYYLSRNSSDGCESRHKYVVCINAVKFLFWTFVYRNIRLIIKDAWQAKRMVPSYFLFCRSSWYNNFFHAFYLDCKTLKVCYYIKGACEKLKFQFCSFSMNMVIFKFAVVNHIHSSIVFAVECRCKLYMRWFFCFRTFSLI